MASSSIVADVSATADDCSLVTAAAFFAASRSSPVTSPRTAEVERIRLKSSFSRPSAAVRSRFPLEGPAQQPEREQREGRADQDGQDGGGYPDPARLAGR